MSRAFLCMEVQGSRPTLDTHVPQLGVEFVFPSLTALTTLQSRMRKGPLHLVYLATFLGDSLSFLRSQESWLRFKGLRLLHPEGQMDPEGQMTQTVHVAVLRRHTWSRMKISPGSPCDSESWRWV